VEDSPIGRLNRQLNEQTNNRGTINKIKKEKKKNIMDRKMSRHIIMKLTIKSISKFRIKILFLHTGWDTTFRIKTYFHHSTMVVLEVPIQ